MDLCLIFQKFQKHINQAEAQADAAGCALGSVITKIIKNGGFPYSVYSMLYDVCVTSIADYGGEVIGYNQYRAAEQLHLRAIRAFLGLPKNTTSCAVLSEFDWLLPKYRGQVRIVRQYHRMLKMEENRLTKQVFLWDKTLNESNLVESWSSELKSIFYENDLNHIYDRAEVFPLKLTINSIKEKFKNCQKSYLRAECESKPKLRTFNLFKSFDCLPAYISKPLSFMQRKFIGKIRTGSLALRIEQGRFSRPRLPEHERVCLVCTSDDNLENVVNQEVEDEFHYIFSCNRYDAIRTLWLSKLSLPENFSNFEKSEKLKFVLNEPDNVKLTAQFIIDAYQIRSKSM